MHDPVGHKCMQNIYNTVITSFNSFFLSQYINEGMNWITHMTQLAGWQFYTLYHHCMHRKPPGLILSATPAHPLMYTGPNKTCHTINQTLSISDERKHEHFFLYHFRNK